jgi:long-chain fatty acid transport protein
MKNSMQLKAAVLAIPMAIAMNTYATNGYFTHGIGTHNKAMAGAGTASPTQAIDAANNPAAAVMVGDRMDAGLSIFSPRRSYKTTDSQLNGQFGSFTVGPNDIDSDADWFPIPYFAKNWVLENDRALAFTMYGRGGMRTDYKGGTATFDPDGPGPGPVMTLDGSFGDGNLGVDLSQLFIELAYAGKAGALNWGIAPVVAIQRFKVDGMRNFAGFTETFAVSGGTEFPTNLSGNGFEWSYGYGAKAGVIYEVSDTLSLALSYQSQMYMTEFDDYSDLFAREGEFDIPASLRGGISWQATGNIRLHFDVEEIFYGDIDSIANGIGGIVNCPTAGFGGTDTSFCLGGDNGIGFGWDDMIIFKVATDWTMASMPKWTFRAGYSFGDHPIPEEQLLVNILAPAVIEEHFTAGFSRELENDHEFSMSFMYAPEVKESGPNTFDPTQDIEIKMYQFEVEFAYSW